MDDLEFIKFLIMYISDRNKSVSDNEPSSLSDRSIRSPVDPNDSISVNVVNQDDLYIPPLQQSLELLRKLSGIDSSSIRDDSGNSSNA